MKKLLLWKNCIINQNYDCFETLQIFIIETETEVENDIISEISEHLNKLKITLEFYFHEQMNAMQQERWIMNPFQPVVTTGISTNADEKLIDLSEDFLKTNFSTRKLVQFWVSLQTSHPLISTESLICVLCSFMNRLILLKDLTEYVIYKKLVFLSMFLPNKVKWVAISCCDK